MPIVTFTTDFGVGDGYAGAMKGVVLSLAPAAQLVDITHGVPPMDVAAGAVALAQAAALAPDARRPAVGANTSRPWNVGLTGSRRNIEASIR